MGLVLCGGANFASEIHLVFSFAACSSCFTAAMVRAVQSRRFPDFGRRLRLVTESCFDIGFSYRCLIISKVSGQRIFRASVTLSTATPADRTATLTAATADTSALPFRMANLVETSKAGSHQLVAKG